MAKIDLSKYTNVTYINHPLVKHKISIIRSADMPTNQFRQIIKEISILEGYEALRNIPTKEKEIVTPIEKTIQPVVDAKSLCFVPILRAGLGMQEGLLELVPEAVCGHIGIYRDEVTREPKEYFCKLPNPISQRVIVVVDPMLATGGSATDAINLVKEKGGKKIKFVSIIGAPQGIDYLHKNHPDVQVYVGCVDEKLNEVGYIVPGLGDAGDRIFGTK